MNLFSHKEMTGLLFLRSHSMSVAFMAVMIWLNTLSLSAQNNPISLTLRNVTAKELFKAIEKKSDYTFFYNNSDISSSRQISVSASDKAIGQILKEALPEFTFRVENKRIIVVPVAVSKGVAKKITGVVTDSDGEPIIGANVVVKGSVTNGTITDADGNFTLNVASGETLLISYIGFSVKEVLVTGESTYNIIMADDIQAIDEVVVVGYGTQKKRDVIGSIVTIKGDDLMKTTPFSIEQGLQGMAAGVQVSNTSGVPGAPVSIKIRGVNSISSSTEPMWIIDGVPVVSGILDNSVNGEVSQSILSMINPNDIESMEVLKDAAATSIYGSRGSNGVILVTTKTGKKGATRIDVDLRTGISSWENAKIGFANNKEYLQIMDMAFLNSRREGQYTPAYTLNQLDGVVSMMTREEALATNTDWVDVISRTGSFLEANMSASQGTDKGNSYMSVKYRGDNSNLKFNDYKTFGANANMNYDLLNVLLINARLSGTYTNNNRVKSSDGKAGAGGWAQIGSNALPWMKVYDPEGVNGYWNPLSAANALAGMDPINAESNLKTINLLSNISGTLKLPVKGLTLKGEFGINHVNNKMLSWRGSAILINGARADESKYEMSTMNYNAYFNFDRTFNDIHGISAVAGVENTRTIGHQMTMSGQNLVGAFHELGSPLTLGGSSKLGYESYLRGYFARANYKFKDRYLLGASIRSDGLSKFDKKNRWATFAAGSVGWIISDEKFFNQKIFNMLKLRGSFGQTGNINVPGGLMTDQYGIRNNDSRLQGTNSTTFDGIGNSDIKWETTNTLDVGIDFGLFNNRLSGSLAYYQRSISNMLLAVSLPLSSGINASGSPSVWQNVGDMRNTGFEFSANAIVVSKKNFTWDIGLNIATNTNKITALDPESDAKKVGVQHLATGGRVTAISKTGYAYRTWYMAESAGVDHQKGIPMIYEVKTNDDGTTSHTGNIIPATENNINKNKMFMQGKTPIPVVVGGLNTNITFKNFDLSAVFAYSFGNWIYNSLYQSMMTVNRGTLALSKDLLTETWQKPGDNARYPQVMMEVMHFYDDQGNPTSTGVKYGSDNSTPSSMYLERGDFIKLRSLQIGYTFPSSITKTLRMSSLKVFVSGNNLLTFTPFKGYDPEVDAYCVFGSMPLSRSFMLGLNVKF